MDEVKRMVLLSLRKEIKVLVDAHIAKYPTPWMPEDLLFPSGVEREQRVAELMDAARGVPDTLRAAFVLNLLTEEGLPSYFHLLLSHLGDASVFHTWIYRWTAEEDRHGAVLAGLARVSRFVPDLAAIERMQFRYLQSGFRPNWQQDPYQLLAYTALQEEATRMSHSNLAAALKRHGAASIAPILGRIAAEEKAHALFYTEVSRLLYRADPDGMLHALRNVALSFTMPGVSLPYYPQLMKIAIRCGIFTPTDFADILSDLLVQWDVDANAARSADGERSRRLLLRLPVVLRQRHAFDAIQGACSYSLPFLKAAPVTI
jgi:acyl-[acyl-carrier-protein] desaturase